jgi:hypothetical protein
MLARIQTLYLSLTLLIIVLNIFVFPVWIFEFKPTPETTKHIELLTLTAPEIINTTIAWFWGYNVLIVTTLFLAFGAIFLFRQRNLQLLFVKSGILSSFLSVVIGAVSGWRIAESLSEFPTTTQPGIGFYMIILMPVLLYLSSRGIASDEKIANAYKRL